MLHCSKPRARSLARLRRCRSIFVLSGLDTVPLKRHWRRLVRRFAGRAAQLIEFVKQTIELAEQRFHAVGEEQIELAEKVVQLAEVTLNSARPELVDVADAIGREQ